MLRRLGIGYMLFKLAYIYVVNAGIKMKNSAKKLSFKAFLQSHIT